VDMKLCIVVTCIKKPQKTISHCHDVISFSKVASPIMEISAVHEALESAVRVSASTETPSTVDMQAKETCARVKQGYHLP